MARRKLTSGLILLGLVGLVLVAALLAPSEDTRGGSYSTQSAGRNGARLVYDLAERLGWKTERRDVEFDKAIDRAPVQVLIGVAPGAAESHALLEFVRAGGALLVAGFGGDLSDSLHLTTGEPGFFAPDQSCRTGDPFEMVLAPPQPISELRWRRPPPGDTIGFGFIKIAEQGAVRPATGFALGAGRVVAVGDADFLANDVVRVCGNQADVAYVRMIEYLTDDHRGTRIAFDEFHHGSGVHGGSLAAIRQYVLSQPSGRLLGQVALAGLLLLFAAAPRPLAPRDSERIARRSPLEHADALARAYMAVGATRTATSRLLAGVRRRARRGRQMRESDEQFLTTTATMTPAVAGDVQTVDNALHTTVPNRDLPSVAAALARVEQALVSRPTPGKP